MNSIDFELYKELLKKESGLVLTPDKSYMLESRLGPVAKQWGYESLEEMTAALQGIPDQNMVKNIVEAMTINETSFFRDKYPFDIFREVVLPYLFEHRASRKELNIWCAAASSGQEPYSLSMILKDTNESPSWAIDLLATDISSQILDQARAGLYSQYEVQRGLPIQMLMAYFTQEDDRWKIKDEIKDMVNYRYFNLLDNMSALGPFDVIFARNVLVYFDEETQKSVLEKMAGRLENDGFLFLGGAETVPDITESFKPMPEQRGLYVKSDSCHLESKMEEDA